VRPEHAQTASAVDTRIDEIGPFWTVKFHENLGSVGERLLARDQRVRPMNVHAGLLEPVNLANRCARDDTPTRHHVAHFLERVQEKGVAQRFRVFEIQIDKETKYVRFLFDNVDAPISAHGRNVLDIERVNLVERHIENPAVHEDVRPRPVRRPPFCKHTLLWSLCFNATEI
jgi:hypothetical protein